MEEQVTIQISYVELEEVDPAPFINKLINEGYVSKLTVREGGIISFHTMQIILKYLRNI